MMIVLMCGGESGAGIVFSVHRRGEYRRLCRERWLLFLAQQRPTWAVREKEDLQWMAVCRPREMLKSCGLFALSPSRLASTYDGLSSHHYTHLGVQVLADSVFPQECRVQAKKQ